MSVRCGGEKEDDRRMNVVGNITGSHHCSLDAHRLAIPNTAIHLI